MENMIYPREKYLSKIRPFYDSDVVKVITGISKVWQNIDFESHYQRIA